MCKFRTLAKGRCVYLEEEKEAEAAVQAKSLSANINLINLFLRRCFEEFNQFSFLDFRILLYFIFIFYFILVFFPCFLFFLVYFPFY